MAILEKAPPGIPTIRPLLVGLTFSRLQSTLKDPGKQVLQAVGFPLQIENLEPVWVGLGAMDPGPAGLRAWPRDVESAEPCWLGL